MSDSNFSDQIPLFDDDAVPEPDPSPRPWRATLADRWREEALPPLSIMEQASRDIVRRNLEFLKAMDLHGGEAATNVIRDFRKRHEELLGLLVRWRTDGEEECAGEAVAAVRDLTDLRIRALEQLDPDRLRNVMAAESRVRVRDRRVEEALRTAEFQLAEERGELVEIEIPALPKPFGSSGLLGADVVDYLVQAQMERRKAEQEQRTLPPREGLNTLLRDLPVEWLDAIWEALELGSDRPRQRKERERTIVHQLTAEGVMAEVVGQRLSEQERQLLAFLLGQGGKALAKAVVRLFGDDDDDGWFWNEEPPTSVLGRVRLHGLAFVGAAHAAHATRTVLVPRDLRQGLKDALALAGTEIEEEGGREGMAAPDLRPELVEALKAAFPDGLVEPPHDEFDMETMEDGVRRELAGLEGARLLYRSNLQGDETWDLPEEANLERPGEEDAWKREEEWEDEREGGWDPLRRSYAVFFLSPPGEGFQFEIRGDFLDEDGHRHPTRGIGRIGWAVALSGLVPFALLRITSLDCEEYFGRSSPGIESRFAGTAGTPMREDEFFRDMLGSEERGVLNDLRREIVRVLESLGIPCLSEEELRQPVPWIVAAETILVGPEEDAALTVEDALFFQHFD